MLQFSFVPKKGNIFRESAKCDAVFPIVSQRKKHHLKQWQGYPNGTFFSARHSLSAHSARWNCTAHSTVSLSQSACAFFRAIGTAACRMSTTTHSVSTNTKRVPSHSPRNEVGVATQRQHCVPLFNTIVAVLALIGKFPNSAGQTRLSYFFPQLHTLEKNRKLCKRSFSEMREPEFEYMHPPFYHPPQAHYPNKQPFDR